MSASREALVCAGEGLRADGARRQADGGSSKKGAVMTVVSTLQRTSIVTSQEEWDKRTGALRARLLPYLERQPGFVSHELRRAGAGGGMVETTHWRSMDDCRAYLRGGGAAMCATWLDAFLPTAPFPDGNWIRATTEQP